ncbi:exported hypothetical protein [Gammaproteobacteria bacterium]
MRRWLGMASVLWLISFAGQAAGSEFSAEVVVVNFKEQSQQTIAKLYMSNNRQRKEVSLPEKKFPPEYGKNVVQIVNPQRQTMWQLFPDAKKYWEWNGKIPSESPPLPGDSRHLCAQNKEIVCNKIGSEDLGGRAVDKWEVTITRDGKAMRNLVWIDTKLGLPIREETPGMGAMELRNIKEGPQPDSLFEAPADFQKIDPPQSRGPAGNAPPPPPPPSPQGNVSPK